VIHHEGHEDHEGLYKISEIMIFSQTFFVIFVSFVVSIIPEYSFAIT